MRSKIRDGLYLGGYDDALAALQGGQEMTHVLSVIDDVDLAAQCEKRGALLGWKVVSLKDSEFENLLDKLEECLTFIDEALLQHGGGGLLVHCRMGVSRSASVVAAYLMRKEGRTADSAVLEVQRLRPQATFPNASFMRQLRLFEAMGCRVDKASLEFRGFRTRELRRAYANAVPLGPSNFASIGVEGESMRCRACHAVLASSSNLLHSPTEECGGSRFVEATQWMTEAITDADRDEGDLACVGCGSLVGKYSWDELPCDCGEILMPAFQLVCCDT